MKMDTLNHLLERVMKYPRLIRLETVKEMTTLSVSTIYRLMKKGQFPKQIKITERSTRWSESEVLNYINEKFKLREES
jgi:prophage regulatory protein